MMFRANEPLVLKIELPKSAYTSNNALTTYAYQTTLANITCVIYDGQGGIVGAPFSLGGALPTGVTFTAGNPLLSLKLATTVLAANATGDWHAVLISSVGGANYQAGYATAYWGGYYETLCAAADLISSLATAANLSALQTTAGLIKTKTDGLPASTSGELLVIQNRTNNLPANTATTLGSPAQASALSSMQGNVTSILTATNSTNLATPLSDIKNRTNNLPANTATLLGTPAYGSLSADLAYTQGFVSGVKTKTDGLPTSTTGELQQIRQRTDYLPANTATLLGNPSAGSSISGDIAAVKGDSGSLVDNLGTPLTGTVATTLEAVKAKTDNLPLLPAAAGAVDDLAMLLGSKAGIFASFSAGVLSFCTEDFLANGGTRVMQISYYDDINGTAPAVDIENAKARKITYP